MPRDLIGSVGDRYLTHAYLVGRYEGMIEKVSIYVSAIDVAGLEGTIIFV